MFSSTGIFRQVPCPVDGPCELPNCLFQHAAVNKATVETSPSSPALHAAKRRRVVKDINDPAKDSRFSLSGLGNPNDAARHIQKPAKPTPTNKKTPSTSTRQVGTGGHLEPATVNRSISPPPLRRQQVTTKRENKGASSTPVEKPRETLNPRKIANDPAGHSTRYLYLKHLHGALQKLDNDLRSSSNPGSQSLVLSPGDLVTMALDEEEKIAKENPQVYANVLKLRLVAYKKMTVDQWKAKRIEDRAKPNAAAGNGTLDGDDRPIETGLSEPQEHHLLEYVICPTNELEKYGHVTFLPTEDAISAAKAGEISGQGFEQCERCGTRFQVFPNRREDGSLTSAGTCTYHPGRRQPPPKTSFHHARNEKLWSCCNDVVGASAGCATADTHVYKVSSTARLAALMQFETTPENSHLDKPSRAVAFDCEMGYTVFGLELIRLTALSWPSGDKLLDVLVKPFGSVLDLNSQFSGVTRQMFAQAHPYDPARPLAPDSILPCVDSPCTARRLLFALIDPSTPLIGHSLENDLNAMRIIHPRIVDTAVLYPHRAGPPYRQALKVLASKLLDRQIQTGGMAGHDPAEDAKAAGDIVRETVKRRWEKMRREGWTIRDGGVCPPETKDLPSPPAETSHE